MAPIETEQVAHNLEIHLRECKLRYEQFEEKLDRIEVQQASTSKHTFELRQLMARFIGGVSAVSVVSVICGILYYLTNL